ncbi:extracellular solute-binding protein [Haloactinopolyspora sp.]|uniref:ABC transporter substrate-binding protein n=1 Tax=Haloactinopolyspora sp. TaxID=1966353 RepID=UPI0026088B0C|nr:extracellular solute-binding protein [Haloactinopolyspora sp.]
MISRRYGVLAALGTLALVITACSPSASEGESDTSNGGGETTLEVWGWRQEDVAAYEKIFQLYEDANPGVTVEYVPYKAEEYDTILRTGLSDQNGPDVAQLRSYGLLQPVVASDSVVPLDDEVDALADFPTEVLDGARGVADGQIYGVPFALQTLHVIYNQAIFDEHGLTPPETWEDMIAAFTTLNDADVVPLAATVTDTWMLPIQHEIFGASTYGGSDYLEQMLAGAATFTDRPWVDSLTTWNETSPFWGSQYKGTSYTDAQALFTSGQAAMFPGGVWELAVFAQANPDLELGIFNVPPPPQAAVSETLVPGYLDGSFGVSANSPNQEAALDLVRWMATPEFGQAFTDELRQISAVPGVEPSDELLAQALDAYLANPSPYVTYAYFSSGEPTAWDLASEGLSNFVLGQWSAEEAADHIQRGVDQWFEPTQ